MSKSIFITGSTDGIGKLAAIQLASEGHDIYIHGRNSEKVDATVAEIIADSKNNKVRGYISDFSDLNRVQDLAHKILNEVPKIDVLVNNAGIFKSPIELNKDGIDIRIAVNYLAPYLLTKELISIIMNAQAPRIINVSSAAQAPLSFGALRGAERLGEQSAYAQSKLALTMWSFHLAREYPNVNVMALNPGSLLNTKMVQEAYGKYWSSAEKGGNIIHDLAISEDYNHCTGQYFDNDKGDPKGDFGPAHPEASDLEKTAQLISITEELIAQHCKVSS